MADPVIPKNSLPFPFARQFNIDLVGVGGNGSVMLSGLARLHAAMTALGHPGFHVQAIDPDLVSEANMGRQLFAAADIGRPKASVLVHRLNLWHGLNWTAVVEPYRGHIWSANLIIGCVDSAAARRSIRTVLRRGFNGWWLDLGNDQQTGQVVLGRWQRHMSAPEKEKEPAVRRPPCVTELFPALLNKKRKESETPSCSMREALGKQDLFINQTVATLALHLLWQWFRQGWLDHHGYWVNLAAGRVAPMPLDPDAWARMMNPPKKRTRKQ